jgi:hypothetical protein
MDGSLFQSNPGAPAPVQRREGGLFEQADLWLPVKTAEGQAEIRQRQRGLSQRQRTMLLLVDGRRSVAQVKQVAVQAGATDTAFDELLDLGLIAVQEPVAPVAMLTLVPSVRAKSQPQAPTLPTTLPPMPIEPLVAVEPEPVAIQFLPEIAEPEPLAELAQPVAVVTPYPPPTSGPDSSGFAPLSEERMELVAEMDSRPPKLSNKRTKPRPGPRIVDSMMSSLFPLLESAFGALGSADEPGYRDDALEEARRILVREIKSKAPVTGSITLMKLRRARNRDELSALFDEVDSHISKPMRHLSAQQTLLHVRGLLAGAPSETWPSSAT